MPERMSRRRMLGRILHRAPRSEADAAGDEARADSRKESTSDRRTTEGGTTGSSANGSFVGRVSGDDHFSGETGAERRAASRRTEK